MLIRITRLRHGFPEDFLKATHHQALGGFLIDFATESPKRCSVRTVHASRCPHAWEWTATVLEGGVHRPLTQDHSRRSVHILQSNVVRLSVFPLRSRPPADGIPVLTLSEIRQVEAGMQNRRLGCEKRDLLFISEIQASTEGSQVQVSVFIRKKMP